MEGISGAEGLEGCNISYAFTMFLDTENQREER